MSNKNSMKLPLYIKFLITIIIIGLLFFSLWIYFNGNQKTNTNSEKLVIKGQTENILTNDFTQKPILKAGQSLQFKKSELYQIVYNEQDQSFNINLMSDSFELARTQAQEAFLEALGISQGQACGLNIWVGIPISVSDKYPGVNLGLSFCPNSVQF